MPSQDEIKAGAKAGQLLAAHWGHQPWSDSWARLVAETVLSAAESQPVEGREWKMYADGTHLRHPCSHEQTITVVPKSRLTAAERRILYSETQRAKERADRDRLQQELDWTRDNTLSARIQRRRRERPA